MFAGDDGVPRVCWVTDDGRFASALERAGPYRVTVVSALEAVPETVSAFICDPVVDGRLALDWFEAVGVADDPVPFIALTTDEIGPSTSAAIQAGVTDCCPVPDGDLTVLRNRLDNALFQAWSLERLDAQGDVLQGLFDTIPSAVLVIDETGRIQAVNDRGEELSGIDRYELVGMPIDDSALNTRRFDGNEIPNEEYVTWRVLETGEPVYNDLQAIDRENGDRVFLSVNGSPVENDGERMVVLSMMDISAQYHYERELERVNSVNAILRGIDQALVSARSRDDVEREVCARLTEAPGYVTAWTGEVDRNAGTVVTREATGAYVDLLATNEFRVDDAPEAMGPTGQAYRNGRAVAFQDVRKDPRTEPWRGDLERTDIHSGIAVPIRYEGTIYGTLTVYADRPWAFGELEQGVLEELGGTIGHAIAAIDRKNALMTEEAVRYTLELDDDSMAVATLSREHDLSFSLVRSVPAGDVSIQFIEASGAPTDEIATVLEDSGVFEDVRVLDESDGIFEVRYVGPSVVSLIARHGGYPAGATAVDGDVTYVVELPLDGNIHAIIDALEADFGPVTIIGKHHVDHTSRNIRPLGSTVEQSLTDRQRTVLELAYSAGFYEWPRERTAAELAATLDISSATFHQHLRAAHGKVLDAVFDDDT